jgi:hypothetical protein
MDEPSGNFDWFSIRNLPLEGFDHFTFWNGLNQRDIVYVLNHSN